MGDRKGERGSRRAVGRRVRSPLPSATGGGRREGDEALRRDARVAELEARLGLRFPDPRRLLEALTHSSYSYEQGPHRFPSNERLEFLGDGVVNLAVAHKLWNELPQHAEGDLTRLRAALVRESTLARWARQLELDRFVLLGVGEDQSGGRGRPALLADTFEAVAGAIFVAFGWEEAQRFVWRFVEEELEAWREEDGDAGAMGKDPKSRLQEWLQRRRKPLPTYRLLRREGPPHQSWFTVSVEWEGSVWGTGQGRSLKEAEEEAAREALRKMKGQAETF